MNLSDKVSYLKGLMDGLDLDTSTKTGRIFSQISDVLKDAAEQIDALNDEVADLSQENYELRNKVEKLDNTVDILLEYQYDDDSWKDDNEDDSLKKDKTGFITSGSDDWDTDDDWELVEKKNDGSDTESDKKSSDSDYGFFNESDYDFLNEESERRREAENHSEIPAEDSKYEVHAELNTDIPEAESKESSEGPVELKKLEVPADKTNKSSNISDFSDKDSSIDIEIPGKDSNDAPKDNTSSNEITENKTELDNDDKNKQDQKEDAKSENDLPEIPKIPELDPASDADKSMDDDDDELYEVECPTCHKTITLTDSNLDEGTIECPYCGEQLEFDFNDISIDDIENENNKQ